MFQRHVRPLIVGLSCTLAAGLAPAAYAKTVITVAMRPDGAGGTPNSCKDAIAAIAKAYTATHPDVEVQFVPLTGNWQDKLTTEMIAGTAPDISEGWGDFARDWAERGLLLDLNPFVRADFTAKDIQDFYPGQWDALVLHSGPKAGLRFGIPHYTNSEVMYFNKELFDKAGLTYPTALDKNQQWNWNTFLQAVKKLTVQTADGKIRQYGFTPYRWMMWVYGAGGKVFDFPENVEKFMLNRPEAEAGLKFLHDLIWVDHVAPPGGEPWNHDMSSGQVGMADYWGSCCIGGLLSAINGAFHVDLANLPQGPQGARHATVFNDMFVITASTKHPKEAWDLVRFMTSTEGAKILSTYERLQPSRYSAIQAFAKLYPTLNAEVAAETAMSAYPSWDTVLPQSRKIAPIVEKAIADSVWNNKAAIQTAVDQAAAQISAIYANGQ